jgi:hypothetical protein
VSEPLAQQILDLIYRDPDVRRMHKDSLADWILDTQSRTAPLDTTALLRYLAAHQRDLLERLKMNLRIQDEVARALASVDPN